MPTSSCSGIPCLPTLREADCVESALEVGVVLDVLAHKVDLLVNIGEEALNLVGDDIAANLNAVHVDTGELLLDLVLFGVVVVGRGEHVKPLAERKR